MVSGYPASHSSCSDEPLRSNHIRSDYFSALYATLEKTSRSRHGIITLTQGLSIRDKISMDTKIELESGVLSYRAHPSVPVRHGDKKSIYDILPRNRRTIRILSLQPGNEDDPLVCELAQVSLEDVRGSYEALSYTWGMEEATDVIFCSDLAIAIGPNLGSALRRIRQPTKRRHVWVDCICVNQSDTAERSYQVSFMFEIYRSAQQVLVWLGEEANRSDEVMEYITRVEPRAALEGFRLRHKPRAFDAERHILEMENSEWPSLVDHFLSRPWFRRVWVQQEAAACPRTIALCGAKTVAWDQLFAFVWMLTEGGTFTSNVARHWMAMSVFSKQAARLIRVIQVHRRIHDKPRTKRPALLFVLHTSRMCEATDPRDRIYAVQHLARQSQETEVLVEPDYQADMTNVCQLLAERYLLRRGLGILAYAGRAVQDNYSLPSWAPDWSCHEHHYRLMRTSGWSAGGRQVAKARIDAASNLVILLTYGAVVGCMVKLSGTIPGEDSVGVDRMIRYSEAEKVSYAMIDKNSQYLGDQTQEEAYWRTLIADSTKHYTLANSPGEDIREKFYEWRLWLHHKNGIALDDRPVFDLRIERTGTFVSYQFGLTNNGHMCLVPALTTRGDNICVLQGLDCPMVVRERGDYYEFIGECYVHGIMQGEASSTSQWEQMKFI